VTELSVNASTSEAFFSFAGILESRDINQESIRAKAWLMILCDFNILIEFYKANPSVMRWQVFYFICGKLNISYKAFL